LVFTADRLAELRRASGYKKPIAMIIHPMNTALIKIQKASPSDLERVTGCARDAYVKYVDRMGCEPAPMQADYASQIADGDVYIAQYGHSFAGYIVFYSKHDLLHLENVAVLPEMSGTGIGRALVEYAERAASVRNLQAVELYTNEAMTENMAMYQNMGYVEIERKQQDGFARVFFRKPV